LSYHTLHSYVKATYEALGLRSRAQVVAEFAGQHIPMR
jgi:hypothetical protein